MSNNTKQAQKAETAARALATMIELSSRIRPMALRVRPGLYYSEAGEPGCAIDATFRLSAYVQRSTSGAFDVSIDDCFLRSSVTRSFKRADAARDYVVSELLARGVEAR